MDKKRLMDIYSQKAMMLGGLRIGGSAGCGSSDMGEIFGGARRRNIKKRAPRKGKKQAMKKVVVGGAQTQRVAAAKPPRGMRSPAAKLAAAQSPWVQHVKMFAAQNGLTYPEALRHPQCKASYRR